MQRRPCCSHSLRSAHLFVHPAIRLPPQTLLKLPAQLACRSAAAAAWGWTSRNHPASTLRWWPNTKVGLKESHDHKKYCFDEKLSTSLPSWYHSVMKLFWIVLCYGFTVSWSTAVSLSPLLGETVVEDTTMLQCNLTGLTSVSSALIETLCFSALVCVLNDAAWTSPKYKLSTCSHVC